MNAPNVDILTEKSEEKHTQHENAVGVSPQQTPIRKSKRFVCWMELVEKRYALC